MPTLARVTLAVAAITLLSRVSGLLREMYIAWQFGLSPETDALSIATSIPYAFYSIIGLSITAAVVPLLARTASNTDAYKAEVIKSLLATIFTLSFLTALVGSIASPQISRLIGLGMPAETQVLAANLTAWSMPSIIFLSLTGAIAGILNYSRRFFYSAIAPGILNIIIIFTAVLLSRAYGIHSIVIGMQIGTLIGLLLLIRSLRIAGISVSMLGKPNFRLIKEVSNDIWPVVLLALTSYIYILIDFRLASTLGDGVVTAINYANRFMQLPQGLFVAAVATVIYPKLSELAAQGHQAETAKLLQNALNSILILAIPGVFGLAIASTDIIQVLFSHGAMNSESTKIMGSLLFWLSFGLPGFCLNLPLIRAFYAFNDRTTPLKIGAACLSLKVATSYWLVASFGYVALAATTSLSLTINAAILAYVLNKSRCKFIDKQLLSTIGKIISCAMLMTAALLPLSAEISFPNLQDFQESSIRLIVITSIGIAIYSLAIWKSRLKPSSFIN